MSVPFRRSSRLDSLEKPGRVDRVEESLRRTQAQLKAFIRQAPISIAMFDRDPAR
jgi:hypothetical protein